MENIKINSNKKFSFVREKIKHNTKTKKTTGASTSVNKTPKNSREFRSSHQLVVVLLQGVTYPLLPQILIDKSNKKSEKRTPFLI